VPPAVHQAQLRRQSHRVHTPYVPAARGEGSCEAGPPPLYRCFPLCSTAATAGSASARCCCRGSGSGCGGGSLGGAGAHAPRPRSAQGAGRLLLLLRRRCEVPLSLRRARLPQLERRRERPLVGTHGSPPAPSPPAERGRRGWPRLRPALPAEGMPKGRLLDAGLGL
ncbi:unnamed protein product, partial [Ectocarpus sp. 12 AP-2014]